MANTYRNAFLDMTTANTTVYTVPNDSRAIIQNIQIANDLTLIILTLTSMLMTQA
jgi:hypothetical protein